MVLSILPFPSICLHKEKQIGNECLGFDRTLKIAFQKNLVLGVFLHEVEPCECVWDQFLRRSGALQGPNLTSGSSGKRDIKGGHLALPAPSSRF